MIRKKWKVEHDNMESKVVSLTTNIENAVYICNQVFYPYFTPINEGAHSQVYAYFTDRVPELYINESDCLKEINIHEKCIAYSYITLDGINIVKTWDKQRLYLWDFNQSILIAFININDKQLTSDPMRIVRGLITSYLTED